MTLCQWCGDDHPIDKLCGRAQKGMTRRAFCFLFGAGAAAALALPKIPFVDELPVYGKPMLADVYEAVGRRFKLAFPNGETWSFDGRIESIGTELPVDGPCITSVGIQPIGPLHIEAGNAYHPASIRSEQPEQLTVDNQSVGRIFELTHHINRMPIDISTVGDTTPMKIPGLKRTDFTIDLRFENDDEMNTLFKTFRDG